MKPRYALTIGPQTLTLTDRETGRTETLHRSPSMTFGIYLQVFTRSCEAAGHKVEIVHV